MPHVVVEIYADRSDAEMQALADAIATGRGDERLDGTVGFDLPGNDPMSNYRWEFRSSDRRASAIFAWFARAQSPSASTGQRREWPSSVNS